MGKSNKTTPAAKHAWESSSQLSRQIPTPFRSQALDCRATSVAPHSPTPSSSDGGLDLDQLEDPHQAIPTLVSLVSQMPFMTDLHTIAADIKTTLSAAITDLKTSLEQVADRLHAVEETSARHDSVIKRLRRSMVLHHSHLLDLRHVEDFPDWYADFSVPAESPPPRLDPQQLQAACSVSDE